MHYDEERENDITNNRANKIKVTLPYSSSVNQHLTITWHLDDIVKNDCADLVKKPKGNV
ncbi:MAG: hypothetical protein HRT38_13500 [Alteromonadaceae bacterium]|nr:hypothetical protein [Alteromonadaceae bacterium]NQY64721.1 hypothetical protein [Alteromonadaceae bacterium]